ncbi:MAG: beta-ketoacyl synthase N-terminal-like domain-containing protein, partial [Myxococcota bacterium]
MGSRVPVVTGLGVVSSAGIGAGRFWEGLFTSEHHFREITLFKPDGLPNRMASEIGPWVPGFEDLDETLLAQSRITAFAAVALREAHARSGTEASSVDRVLVGTTCGDIASQEASIRAARVDGYDEPMRLRADSEFRASLSTHCADVHVKLLVTACSAGNLAAIRAAQMIEAGEADVVVAGGAEAFSRMAFVGFARMRGMAAEQCRPFSEARDGLLLGEGAAFAVLESAEHAAARGAVPLAEVSGYGMSCDAKHPAAPDSTG